MDLMGPPLRKVKRKFRKGRRKENDMYQKQLYLQDIQDVINEDDSLNYVSP